MFALFMLFIFPFFYECVDGVVGAGEIRSGRVGLSTERYQSQVSKSRWRRNSYLSLLMTRGYRSLPHINHHFLAHLCRDEINVYYFPKNKGFSLSPHPHPRLSTHPLQQHILQVNLKMFNYCNLLCCSPCENGVFYK